MVSSPFVRCTQTVEPLAEARGLPVETDEALAEERLADAVSLVRRLAGAPVALCTHGDVVPAVLEVLAGEGMQLTSAQRWAKASVWLLAADDGRYTRATYLPPQP